MVILTAGNFSSSASGPSLNIFRYSERFSSNPQLAEMWSRIIFPTPGPRAPKRVILSGRICNPTPKSYVANNHVVGVNFNGSPSYAYSVARGRLPGDGNIGSLDRYWFFQPDNAGDVKKQQYALPRLQELHAACRDRYLPGWSQYIPPRRVHQGYRLLPLRLPGKQEYRLFENVLVQMHTVYMAGRCAPVSLRLASPLATRCLRVPGSPALSVRPPS